MVFEAVKPEIKEQIITMHLIGKGRNQIFRELSEQGMKVSLGLNQ